jgi:glucokinase
MGRPGTKDAAKVVLAGDIGGTNTRLWLLSGGRTLRRGTLPSRTFADPADAIITFLDGVRVDVACLGIAGPVIASRGGGRCVATNLPWTVDAARVARRSRIRRVVLINDLVVNAMGALHAPSRAIVPLWGTKRPARRGKNLAVLAAGTGLGEAALVWATDHHVALATEGSHADFGPRHALEDELLAFLRGRFPEHVSYERVLSGPGIGNLYDFFREARGVREAKGAADTIARAKDRNAAITEQGLGGRSRPARLTLELFASLYGAEAGNLALKTMSTGGVLLVGSITAKLRPLLEDGRFRRSFVQKGRLGHVLEDVPVAIVDRSDLGLEGAAFFAQALAQGR